MKSFIFKFTVIIFLYSSFTYSQVEQDSIKFRSLSVNCATKLGKDYMVKVGILERGEKLGEKLELVEIVTGNLLEEQKIGVFKLSTLSKHRLSLIILKNHEKIKILTFTNLSRSMTNLISFLEEQKVSNQRLLDYINHIQSYLKVHNYDSAKRRKSQDSEWIECK